MKEGTLVEPQIRSLMNAKELEASAIVTKWEAKLPFKNVVYNFYAIYEHSDYKNVGAIFDKY